MRPWVSEVPREYRDWLGGVEPAWTVLEPRLSEMLMGEPPFEGGALHLAVDLTADELAQSVLVQNALVLLGAVAEGDGLKLTARKNLTRSTVAAMRDAMVWPGYAFEERRRAGKVLSEDHVDELRLLRALVEIDGVKGGEKPDQRAEQNTAHRGRGGEVVRGGQDWAWGGGCRKRREGVARPEFPAQDGATVSPWGPFCARGCG